MGFFFLLLLVPTAVVFDTKVDVILREKKRILLSTVYNLKLSEGEGGGNREGSFLDFA